MHPDLPIEQLVRRKDTRFQLGFATEAKQLLPSKEGVALALSPKGLRVLGRNEDALAMPVEILREVYGAKVHVLPPEVRLIQGVQVKQPIMHVRLTVQLRFLDVVKRAFLERGAIPEEEHVGSRYCVLRYLTPLAYLLGLPAELSLLTEGKARHWIVLSHYALVTGDPGGRAA